MCHAKGGGVIPVTGFPWFDGMEKQGGMCKDQFETWCKHGHLIHHSCIRSMGGHLGVIPSKRAFRGGSKSSREVVVHGS